MPNQILIYLHLLSPFLLSIPLLTLFPSPPQSQDELPGIRPITIRTVTPRRAFILTVLSSLAVTSFADAAVLVGDLLTAKGRGDIGHLEGLSLASEVVYAVGGFLIWALAAVVCEWRARWGDVGVSVLSILGLICEIPNLVLLVVREVHTHDDQKLFTILSIPPSVLRLLILPVLLVIVLSPVIRYQPADETTGLLSNPNGGPSTAHGRQPYGSASFEEENGTVKADPLLSSVTATGTNTPAGQKPSIKIPKTLGEVKKEDKPLPIKEVWVRLKKLSPHLWPSTSRRLQFYCILCIGLLACGRVLQPLVPISLGRVVRSLSLNQAGGVGPSPWPALIAYFAFRLAVSGSGILYFLQQRLWIPVSQYTDREMMMLCFNHLLNLSLAYHTKRNTGEVLKVIDRGSAINNLFSTVIFTAMPTILDIVIAFGVFFYLYGGLLASVTIVVMTFYIGFSVFMTQKRVVVRRLLMEKDVKQRGIVSDVLTNWESVKYFTAERREIDRFREAIVSYQETEAKWDRNWQLVNLIQSLLLALGLMLGSLVIARRVLRGTADAAEFVVFLQYFQQLTGPLDRLAYLYRSLNQNTTDAEKMFSLLAEATEVNDKPGSRDLVVTDGVIVFDNVCFSYDSKVEALKGVSFKIDKGQSMALVGESGSGKSTILRLLYRFYDLTSGHIYIDGQDISQVTQVSLRRAIGIVPQDSVLWNDTIGANISYGKEGATDDEIVAAAEAARLHERILSFTDSYSTVVGERGIRLSGGEKQRVSLARMFLKSPAILVLDEATSALDTSTERDIQRALSDLAKGRSSLSIAHRLSTIINSDQIVVMKDGQVIENGGYKELLDLNGSFATMWKNQIFTEAEMVAQAEQVAPEGVANDQPSEEAVSNKLDNDDDGHGGHDETPAGGKQSDSRGDKEPVEPFEKAEGCEAEEEAAIEPDSPAIFAEKSTAAPIPDAEAEQEDKAALETSPIRDSSFTHSARGVSTTLNETDTIMDETPNPGADSPDPALPPDSSATEVETAGIVSAGTPDDPSTLLPAAEQASVPFPQITRVETSHSIHSTLSENDSGASTSDVTELAPVEGKDKEKRRTRLSSLKGFVRRISDHQSTRSPGGVNKAVPSGKSPMGEMDEATAMLSANVSASGSPNGEVGDKRKKRLSLKKKD